MSERVPGQSEEDIAFILMDNSPACRFTSVSKLIRKAVCNNCTDSTHHTNTLVIRSGGECGLRMLASAMTRQRFSSCHRRTLLETNDINEPFPDVVRVNFDVVAWAGRYRRRIMAPNRFIRLNFNKDSLRPLRQSLAGAFSSLSCASGRFFPSISKEGEAVRRAVSG